MLERDVKGALPEICGLPWTSSTNVDYDWPGKCHKMSLCDLFGSSIQEVFCRIRI